MNNQNQINSHNNHNQIYVKHEDFNPNTNGLSPSADADRIRHRFDGLRRHHNESADIYNRTQPIINEQIHNETLKYLKSGQVNGTKTKSQKPRAPKRQRNSLNSTTNITNTSSNNAHATNNFNNAIINQPNPTDPGPIQQQHPQQINLYPPRIQQPIQVQHPQHIPHNQGITTHHHIPQQQSHQHPQHQMYQPQIQHQSIQPSTHLHSMIDPPQSSQSYSQTHNQMNGNHNPHIQNQHQYHIQNQHSHQTYYQNNINHMSISSLPNDLLDLDLQLGLECDVDSLINYEISVEGQLNFNHDFLLKLDNHYPTNQHH